MSKDRVHIVPPTPAVGGAPLTRRPDKTVILVGYPDDGTSQSPLLLAVQRFQAEGYNNKIIVRDVHEASLQLATQKNINHISV